MSAPGSLRPRDTADLVDLVASAIDRGAALAPRGQATKRGFGRPVGPAHDLDLGQFTGIGLYEPDELVIGAGAATPMADLLTVMNQSRQHFAFEPPDLAPFYGHAAGAGTIGGAVACNLAGPRRIAAGAARDHFLGFTAVNGRAESFKAGSRVMKNVTGYDLPKLLAGSFGTLAVMTGVTLKVLPRPEKTRTVMVLGLDDAGAARCLSAALGSSHEVSGAAHLPAAVAAAMPVDMIRDAGTSATLVRVEGPGPSVTARAAALHGELAGFGRTEELHSARSLAAWAALRDLRPFVERPDDEVWRLSVAPTAGAGVAALAAADLHWFDWGGGLVWLGWRTGASGRGAALRKLVAAAGGGHVTLMRAADATRAAEDVFGPQPAALAALTDRVKAAFDPRGVLNPGRMRPTD
jgi:glycolate oxidase FAD binding subunit